LSIRGQHAADAVLCTSDRTYALRSVALSNSLLIVTPEDAFGNLVVRDQLKEILELVPSAPKLYRLSELTRGMEYGDAQEGEGEEIGEDDGATFEEQATNLFRRTSYAFNPVCRSKVKKESPMKMHVWKCKQVMRS
jgi:hypothetical protein